jgi:hypothetical protein
MDGTPTGFEYTCITGSTASPLLVAIDGRPDWPNVR